MCFLFVVYSFFFYSFLFPICLFLCYFLLFICHIQIDIHTYTRVIFILMFMSYSLSIVYSCLFVVAVTFFF